MSRWEILDCYLHEADKYIPEESNGIIENIIFKKCVFPIKVLGMELDLLCTMTDRKKCSHLELDIPCVVLDVIF